MDYATLLGLTPQPAGVPVAPAVQPVVQSVAAPQVDQYSLEQSPPATAAPVAEPTVTPVPPPAQVQEVPLAPLKTDATPQEKLGFFEKLRTDPNLAQSVMMMGLNMMQGPRDGENFLGLAGRSGMLATQAKQFLDQSSVDQQRQAAESQSLIKSRDTQTASTQQQIDQRAQEFPQTLRKLQLDIDNATTDGQRKRAEAKMKEFESDPARMAENLRLDQNVRKGQAASAFASANSANATAAEKKEATKMRQWAQSGTEEQQAAARRYFAVDDPTSNAMNNKNEFLATQMKNLGWDDKQIAQRLLEINDPTNAKGDVLNGLIFLANDETDPTTKQGYMDKIRVIVESGMTKNAGGAKPAGAASVAPPAAGTALPAGVPEGSVYVGTSNGKPVYKTPAGKQVIVK
jgi:hypothetical protein